MKNTAVLLVQCPDTKGLDATIADFIYRHDGNIPHFEQHQAGETPRLYLARVEWAVDDFKLGFAEFPTRFGEIAERFSMQWRVALGRLPACGNFRFEVRSLLGGPVVPPAKRGTCLRDRVDREQSPG